MLAVGLLALTALVLFPAAGASLYDPLWIAGIYDGGDYDDAVALAGDADSLEPPAVALRSRTLAYASAVPAATARRQSQLRSLSPRAPPSA
jgi:hypothetical protein